MSAERLTLSSALLALVTVFLNAGAQLLLRGAALRGADPRAPMTLLTSPMFVGALAAYGLSVLTWLSVLRKLPLSIALPFVALVYVIVPLGARAFFGDEIGLRWAVGTALLVAGVVVVAGA